MLPDEENHVDKPHSSSQPDSQPSEHSNQSYQYEPPAGPSGLNPRNSMLFSFQGGGSAQYNYFPAIALANNQPWLQSQPSLYRYRYPYQHLHQYPHQHLHQHHYQNYQSELDNAQDLVREAVIEKNYMEAQIQNQANINTANLKRLDKAKHISKRETNENRIKAEKNAEKIKELEEKIHKLEEEKKRKKNDELELVKSTTAEIKKLAQEQERVAKEKAQIKLAQEKAQLEKQVQTTDNPAPVNPSSTTSKSETPTSSSNTIQKSKKKIKKQSPEKKAEPEKKEKPKASSEKKLSITSPSSANSPSTSHTAESSISVYTKIGGEAVKKRTSKQKKKVKNKPSSPTTNTATPSTKNSGQAGQCWNYFRRVVPFSNEDDSPSTSRTKMTKKSRKVRKKALKKLKANQNSTPTTIQNPASDSAISDININSDPSWEGFFRQISRGTALFYLAYTFEYMLLIINYDGDDRNILSALGPIPYIKIRIGWAIAIFVFIISFL